MRVPRPPDRDDSGMSLVEVMIAIVLIGLVFAAMVGAIINGLRSVQQARGQVAANQLANEQIEILRTRLFSAVAPASGTTQTTNEAAVVRNGVSYDRSWTSTWVNSPCNGSGSTQDFLRLNVEVTWRHRDGDADLRKVALETYRTPTPRDGTSFAPVRTDTLSC